MKSYCIKVMPLAKAGLLNIGEYIALDNPTRALSFVDEITESIHKTLSLFPYSGKVAKNLEVAEEIRIWTYGNYNSYYRILEDKQLVEVLFVFHASRDVQALIHQL